MRLIKKDDELEIKCSKKEEEMEKDNNEIHNEFSESYIKLCMTGEITLKFGPPLVEGNHCIYKDDPNEIYRVVHYGGENTDIDVGGEIEQVKTSDLIWLPTPEEIRREFYIEENDGFWHGYDNFIKDPEHFGYSRAELSQFLSEEERWLLYCMIVEGGKKFMQNIWTPFKYQ
jgi:hypothetical protein